MKNSRAITKVSLLLGTIICLGAFFLVDNNIPVQALHKEEQILDDYDDLAEFANAVKNGDEEDLEEIPIQSMEAADIYDDADDSLKDCIDLAAKVGDSLSDREVIHCVDDVNYFKTKYSSNSTVPSNGTFATSTTPTDTDTDTGTDATSTSEASTSDDATSTSEASTSDDVTENNLIKELVNTGKFTENEAKEFVSKNMLSATTSGDTQTTSSADTSADDTSSSNNESDDSSGSNTNNPEQYGSLSELVDDVKNGDIDTDEISLNDFQNSGAYQGADQATQDCIDLAGKIGGNLIDYEIVRCSEDPNHFKNQIANNDAASDENDAASDENDAASDENNAASDENNANNNNGVDNDTGN